MNNIKQQHDDEIELLQSILLDNVVVIEKDPWSHIDITIKPDIVDKPQIELVFSVFFNEKYPEEECFVYKIKEKTNKIMTNQINILNNKIKDFYNENKGFPIVFQVTECIKDYINTIEEKLTNEITLFKKLEEEKVLKQIENSKKLIEERTFTPVNQDNYDKWFKAFMAEKDKIGGKELKIRKEIMARKSGREIFSDLKTKKEDLINDDLEDGEDVDYSELHKKNNLEQDIDADLYGEDIDLNEIDFDD